MNPPPLKYALLAGAACLYCAAVAHYYSGIKQSLLFIYYDTPFYAYHDKMDSFAVVAYIARSNSAVQPRSLVPAALAVLEVTVPVPGIDQCLPCIGIRA